MQEWNQLGQTKRKKVKNQDYKGGWGTLRGGSQRVRHGHQAFNRRFLVVAE